ncbi:hypothetical protein ACFLTH_10660, partial [Bacteroidota bacterium]
MQDHQETEFSNLAKLKKYLPGAALFILTLSLMIFFKYNKQEIRSMIETGKGNLFDFYTQNLKPLLFKTDISNEDIFNFALYQNIPIDKAEKKVLQINEESSGYDVFTVQPTVFRESTSNYEKFKHNLELNEKEKARVDSILESYKNELYSSILVNENNTIAVNPRVIDLRKAIVTDIALFAKKINEGRFDKFSEKDFEFDLSDAEGFADVIDIAKSTADNDFIFITPDTVFTSECEFDRAEMLAGLETARADYSKAIKELDQLKIAVKIENMALNIELDSLVHEKIHFQIDSIRSVVAIHESQRLVDTELKKLNVNLENVDKMLRSFSFRTRSISDEDKNHDSDFDADWEMNTGVEININLDSIIHTSLQFIEDMDFEELETLNIDIDSLMEVYNSFPYDSIRV